MRVLDASFLVDYLADTADAVAYHETNGGDEEHQVMPASAHAETLVGVGNHPAAELARAIETVSWGEVYRIDGDLSAEAARIPNETGPQGPYLDGIDAPVPAVGRTLNAPVVSAGGDLTHGATKRVIAVEEYR